MNSFISNSKKIPKAFLTAFFLTFLTVVIGALYLIGNDQLPAPMFTERVSLDERLRDMHLKGPIKAEYITLGSSIALNSVSSEVMMSHPKMRDNYYNFSIWHLMVSNLQSFWYLIDEIYAPKVIFVCISVSEYQLPWKEFQFDVSYIKKYIEDGPTVLHYIANHKAGFMRRIYEVKKNRNTNKSMGSLKFDKGGGALVDIPESKRSKDFLNVTPDKLEEESYQMLSRWLEELRNKNVKAIIIQPPLRDVAREHDENFPFLDQHWDRVNSIAESHGMHFLNMHKLMPTDKSYFTDSTHLGREGATLFTEALLREIEKRALLE